MTEIGKELIAVGIIIMMLGGIVAAITVNLVILGIVLQTWASQERRNDG